MLDVPDTAIPDPVAGTVEYVSVPVPPVGVKTIVPLLFPLQLGGVVVAVTLNCAGLFSTVVWFVVHPFASVTVIV